MRTYDYIVKTDEKVVVCIMTVSGQNGSFRCSGVAKCSPDDTFSEETGKQIAQRRALLKFKKAVLRANKSYARSIAERINDLSEMLATRNRASAKIEATIERIKAEIAQLG